jgi:hypothetical protein
MLAPSVKPLVSAQRLGHPSSQIRVKSCHLSFVLASKCEGNSLRFDQVAKIRNRMECDVLATCSEIVDCTQRTIDNLAPQRCDQRIGGMALVDAALNTSLNRDCLVTSIIEGHRGLQEGGCKSSWDAHRGDDSA